MRNVMDNLRVWVNDPKEAGLRINLYSSEFLRFRFSFLPFFANVQVPPQVELNSEWIQGPATRRPESFVVRLYPHRVIANFCESTVEH